MEIKSYAFKYAKNIRYCLLRFIYWLALAVCLGAICGLFGALFSKSISAVTSFRQSHSRIVFLLPLGGIATVAIYKAFKVFGVGTDRVFESVRGEDKVSFLLALAVFAGTAVTHLLGGSAGREGAALQLGGGFAALLGKLFGLNEKASHILTVCGMGAFFSALFGAPLGACVFALEVVNVGFIYSAAVFPALVSSITAYITALFFGVEPERFNISTVLRLNPTNILKTAVIAALGAAVSVIFCLTLRGTHILFDKYLKNAYLRAAVGGCAVVILTLAVGTSDYNGSGMEVIKRIFDGGTASNAAFLLKIIFTAVTVAAGFKGGEIIPTMFIGASLGASAAPLLGIDTAVAAELGMAALFCGVTNCPIASIVLFAELFGGKNTVPVALAVGISFFLSGSCSLYSGQRAMFSKFTDESVEKADFRYSSLF